MPTETDIYQYIINNQNQSLINNGSFHYSSRWVKFSDGTKLPFSWLPDEMMKILEVTNENGVGVIYRIVPIPEASQLQPLEQLNPARL